MKWYCFLFWFVYRLVLACLAHFNWCMALYHNCVYFTLWKSYDLLWFWMHLMLCSCFPQLRRENYLIVWCNLIWKRWKFYPHHTYKQLYLMLYGGKGTKAEQALHRMDTIEKRERESRRIRKLTDGSSSSSDEEDNETMNGASADSAPKSSFNVIAEEEEAECRKYVYVGQAVDSQAELKDKYNGSANGSTDASTPLAPPRPSRNQPQNSAVNVPAVTFNVDDIPQETEQKDESSGEESDSNSTKHWIQRVPNAIKNRFRRKTQPTQPSCSHMPLSQDESGQDSNSISTWSRIRGMIPNPIKFNRTNSNNSNPADIDVLRCDYSNTYDLKDPKKVEKREKRDRKELTTRLRKRLREELKEEARKEKKRRMVTDAIELLLQLLRMMTSFAILTGNIRKTFIPAQFKYLRPGQHAYDNYEMLLIFRVTTFIDVAMFWTNILWVYCLQWHLCCRLGFVKFWSWAALLATVALTVMIIPMGYAMNQMDLSWCRFVQNSTLDKYQPSW